MQLLQGLKKNPIIHTLLNLQGNARACVLTEPLWGIPYTLYAPFISLYMAALGLSDGQIGLMSTIHLVAQFACALMSGVLTDKLGRRKCTFYFDILAWGVATLLWAFAQNVTWFVVAALFNSIMRVTTNSWNLLLVEDEDDSKLVHLFAIVNIAALLAGFFSPLAFIFVRKFGVVPTMRGLYLLAFVLMTAKFVILLLMSHETRNGEARMKATREASIGSLLRGSGAVLWQMLRTPKTMLTVGLLACFLASKNITDAFWPLLVTSKLGVSEESLSIYATLRTLVMLVCYFTVVPRMTAERFKHPLLLCFLLQAAAKVLLIVMPEGATWLLVLTVLMEAFSLSLLNPLTESLQMINLDVQERARMLALFYALVLLVTSPMGVIAGWLSQVHRMLPFVLTLGLYAVAIVLSLSIWAVTQREQLQDTTA